MELTSITALSRGTMTSLLATIVILITVTSFWIHDVNADETAPDLLRMQYGYRRDTTSRDVTDDCRAKVVCKNSKLRPVCATDGRIYPSKCDVKRARKCEGKKIRVKAKGRCKPQRAGHRLKCPEERQQALAAVQVPTSTQVYIPECRADGTYQPVQCHEATGYCWCVTDYGRPVPGSSVQGRRLSCPEKRKGSKGNGQLDLSSGVKRRRGVPGKRQGKCSPANRAEFNANLIELFSLEYARVPKPTQPQGPDAPKDLPIESTSDALLDTAEKLVIEWKFSELDVNKDSELRIEEVAQLKKMIKRLVKPKVCAKDFNRHCDLNRDRRIARGEWSVCLGVGLDSQSRANERTFPAGGSSGPGQHLTGGSKGGVPRPRPPSPPNTSAQSLFSLIADDRSRGPSPPPRWPPVRPVDEITGGQEESLTEPPQKRSCEDDRAAALETEGNFVPACEPGGRFRREQCHNSTRYCWCVEPETGMPIWGTSAHNVLPNCTNIKQKDFKGQASESWQLLLYEGARRKNKIAVRDIGGCSYPLKKKFLTKLMDKLTTEMVEFATNVSQNSPLLDTDPDHSIEERAVRWKLRILDKNRNEALDRKEIRMFKKDIRMKKDLRKCSRNFIKYCDEDNDKKITMDEWIDCMGLNEPKRNLPDNHKRGPNPFDEYLRDS